MAVDENEAMCTKMISEINQNLEQVYGILGSPLLKQFCVRDNEVLAEKHNFFSGILKPTEEKAEIDMNGGGCTCSNTKGMEQLSVRLKAIEAKLMTQKQSMDSVSRSTTNLASSSNTNFAQTTSILLQLIDKDRDKDKDLEEIRSNLVVTRQLLEDSRALILEQSETQEALLRPITALYEEKISDTRNLNGKQGTRDIIQNLEQKIYQLLNSHTNDVANSTKEIGKRIHSGIDSFEKILKSETNAKQTVNEVNISFSEQRKYIEKKFSEMKNIILRHNQEQQLEISHLKAEIGKKIDVSKQNILQLSKALPPSNFMVNTVTEEEASGSLEEIIKQNFLETDKIILRLEKVQEINSRKFNWFLFIQTILFVVYLLSFWVHSIQGFHDYSRSL